MLARFEREFERGKNKVFYNNSRNVPKHCFAEPSAEKDMDCDLLFEEFMDPSALDFTELEGKYPLYGYSESPDGLPDQHIDSIGLSCPVDVYLDYLFSKGIVDSMDDHIILASECDEVGELKEHLISSVFNSYYKQTFEIEKGTSGKDNLVLSASLLLPDSDQSSDTASLSDASSDVSDNLEGLAARYQYYGAGGQAAVVEFPLDGQPGAICKGQAGNRGERVRRRVSTREYKCNFPGCTKVYTKSSHLKAHIRRHTGEKPFACTWKGCNWRFSRSDELARHKRSHSGIKPFICDLCDKRFSRSDHLAKHRKTHYRTRKNSTCVMKM